MPRLVAQRLAQRLAQHDRDVLDRVVGVDLDVAGRSHRQVEARRACPAGRACGRRTATPVAIVGLPGAVEVDLDQHLRLLGDPLDPPDPAHPCSVSSTSTSAACRNASFSSGVPIVTRSRSRDPDVPDQHPAVQEGPPRRARRRRTGRTARSSRRWAPRRNPPPRSAADHPVPLGPQQRHRAERRVGVPQRRARRSLGQRRQVVRQANELQRLDDGRRRGQVAQAAAREGERLAHRAADDQLFPCVGSSASGADGRSENSAYASSTTTMPRRGVDERGELAPAPATCRSGCSGW